METLQTKQEINLDRTLTLGEVFSWEKYLDKWYGFIKGYPVALTQVESNVIGWSNPDLTSNDIWAFFHCDMDYSPIEQMCETDYEKKAYEYCKGARIIQQELDYTVLTSILTPRKRWEEVNAQINSLCKMLGQEYTIDDVKLYSFPDLYTLDTDLIDFGMKTDYFRQAVLKLLKDKNDTSNYMRIRYSYDYAKMYLTSFSGIGEKVASYICLYALGYTQAVPIDTHLNKIIKQEYNGCYFPTSRFKDLSGIMSQYMYTYDVQRHRRL